jgi:diguanylate cyclase (GGDEF)-like protein/PAS domain S-box-containing protein
MNDLKTVLIVDDAKRFTDQALFEPELLPHFETGVEPALTYLAAHPGVAITLINFETAPSEGLALLTAIRARRGLDAMAVWFSAEPWDQEGIRRSYEAGADELIYRVPCDVAFQYQIRRFKAFPTRYEGRNTPVLLAGIADVPGRCRTEQTLRESERKLAAMMNAVPGGIALYDLRGAPRLLYSNEILSAMSGYTPQEYEQIMGENFHALIDPRDHGTVDSMIEAFRQKPQRQECVFRILTRDRLARWVHCTVSPVSEGLECSAFYFDVTQEKENEARNERMRSELIYRAVNDALTGILNRETFYSKTEEMLHADPDTPYVILMMDIDRFKVINDMFGKEVGDRILVAIAEGLRSLLAGVGTCARMEADHFAACFPQALLDMEQILALFDTGLMRQNVDFQIQISYGIYQIHNIGVPVNHMCDRAVMALKTIKGSAVKRYAFYDDKLRQALLEENAILDEMNGALEQGQFIPYLQPVFAVDSRRPVSAEVLVRWQHPVKGLIPPGQFIPLFERNGFVTKLDMYVWEQACKLLKRWQEKSRPLPLSVNISRIDLYCTRLCDHLIGLTKRYGVDPSMLQLEITEGAYSKDPGELAKTIDRLRANGFSILMDDFGSGYSSLNVLMDMPVDILKLDAHFLAQLKTNPRAASILTSAVHMAKWLNMPVVAEGVETAEQLAFLRSIGCDNAQGYLLAEPMDTERFESQFIRPAQAKLAPLRIVHQNTVDLSSLWDTSAQGDALFNGMIGGMGLYELSGDTLEIRRVNDGYYELFGCTPQQVFDVSREALSGVHPDDRRTLLDTCRKAVQSGRVERCVCRHVHFRGGREMWVETHLRFLGKAGLNDVFCFTYNDVTEQKEFEKTRALRNYALVLSGVYSDVFELNFTTGRTHAVHTSAPGESGETKDQPWEKLKAYLRDLLLTPDVELETQIFTDGYLRGRLAESQSGYYSLERRVRAAGGASRWASFTFIPMPSEAAEEIYLLCVADVDNRKRAEELLVENRWLQLKQQEQARYQELMEHLGTSLFEWEVDNGRVTVSPGFSRYAVGTYDFQTLRSHKDMEPFVYHKDLNLYWLLVNDLLAHGSGSVTLRLLDTSGRPVWCRVLCSLVRDEYSRTARCIAAINQIDEQMKIRENYLDEQSRFQAFAENFLVGLGIFEMRGEHQRILYLSGGYRKMIGYDDGERFYDDVNTFSGVHPDDVPRFLEATQRLQKTGEPFTIDYRVFHRDGRILWMRSLNTLYPGPEPNVNRIFAVIKDITELRALQTRMDAMTDNLPVGVGVYGLGKTPSVRYENRRLAAMLRGGGPLARSGLEALLETDFFRRVAADGRPKPRETDEWIRLRRGGGQPTPFRLLAATVEGESGPECYCAFLEASPAAPEPALPPDMPNG